MLERLCRWLRLLGYPTVSAWEIVDPREHGGDEDEVILEFALKGHLLITRDSALADRAGRAGLRIESGDVAGQLAEVLSFMGDDPVMNPDESRCPDCNEPVMRVEEGNPGPFEVTWMCPRCGKKYWVGRQWEEIEGFLERVKRVMDTGVPASSR